MKNNLPDKQSNFLLYTGKDGKVNIEVFLKDESVWLTQKAMGQLFGVKIPAISKHLLNIFESEELQKEATLSILETVQKEGGREMDSTTRKIRAVHCRKPVSVRRTGIQQNPLRNI